MDFKKNCCQLHVFSGPTVRRVFIQGPMPKSVGARSEDQAGYRNVRKRTIGVKLAGDEEYLLQNYTTSYIFLGFILLQLWAIVPRGARNIHSIKTKAKRKIRKLTASFTADCILQDRI